MPVIDGYPLADLVAEYEASQAVDVVGGYMGIAPVTFDFGPLDQYFLGARDHRYWGQLGKIAVLGCNCGEVGCWPLYSAVQLRADEVGWTDFVQPHRPNRDYSGFGPFSFDRGDYEAAIEKAITDLARANG